MDPAFEALWQRTLDHWDEESVHHAFLEYCKRSDQLVEAATRYRGACSDGERAEVAQKRLTAITALALAKLESTRTVKPAVWRRSRLLVLAMLILAAMAAALVHMATVME